MKTHALLLTILLGACIVHPSTAESPADEQSDRLLVKGVFQYGSDYNEDYTERFAKLVPEEGQHLKVIKIQNTSLYEVIGSSEDSALINRTLEHLKKKLSESEPDHPFIIWAAARPY